MAGTAGTPLTSGRARVFLIEGRARGDHDPSYEYQFRLTGPSQSFGDITKLQEPDPNQYESWVDVEEIRGATERATFSLEGHYARDLLSKMLKLARKKCAFDLQVHFGACQDPRSFNEFDKILVFENAKAATWSAGDLGALQSDDNAMVDETLEGSARNMYEIVPVGFGTKAGSIVTNEVLDVVIADAVSCGDCEGESDGCYKIFAITTSAGGSPSTPADVVFSLDKGVTWYAHDIDSLLTAEAPSGVDVVGQYLIVVSNASNSLHYVLKSDLDGTTDPAFTEVATGFVTNYEPNAIYSIGNMAFIVGDGGYVYTVGSDPSSGVTVLEAGSLTAANLRDIHALSEDFAVAVGDSGVVMFTENGSTWSLVNKFPVGIGVSLGCVFVKSKFEWWVGSSSGRLYYTLNMGDTWTESTFSGSGTGTVEDIEFSSDTVGWLSHTSASNVGRLFRSYDGGNSWNMLPESSATLPDNDKINAVATCFTDTNFIVGVGLGADGADGYIVVGSA